MTSLTQNTENSCYTDYALQEYTLQRLSDPVRESLSAHLKTCQECAKTLSTIDLEVSYFQELENIDIESALPCPDELQLALYIDGADTEPTREDLLAHLQTCRNCRDDLIEIRTETAHAFAQDMGESKQAAESTPIILTMPTRVPNPTNEQNLPKFTTKVRRTGS
jgi:anti-sigma factor RsiW